MKAWLPKVLATIKLTSRNLNNNEFLLGAKSKLASRGACRYFSSSTSMRRFSLADRIKQFLPSDALEDTSKSKNQRFEEIEYGNSELSLQNSVSLAAFESEVNDIEILLKQYKFETVCDYILQNITYQVAITIIMERLVPWMRAGSLGDLGILELAFTFYKRGHAGLSRQILQGCEFDNFEVDFSVVSLLIKQNLGRTVKEIDLVINQSYKHRGDLHFPQLLSNPEIHLWLKIKLLAQLNANECEKWLSRYSSQWQNGIVFLALNVPHMSFISKWALKIQNLELLGPLLRVFQTPEQFHSVLRPLLRPQRAASVDENLAFELLKCAIRLKQTYDIANVCRRFSKILSVNSNISVWADALLAAAFAQRRPPKETAVTLPIQNLQNDLVAQIVKPLYKDPDAYNAIVSRAAVKLGHIYKPHRVAGQVLWQLLSSLPQEPLNNHSLGELAKLMMTRPYIEQIRYMALPIVSDKGIVYLLKLHINNVVSLRKAYNIGKSTLQAKEDIQLLVAGIIMASEKSKHLFTTSSDQNMGKEFKVPTLQSVSDLFENWTVDKKAQNLLESVTNDVQCVSPSIITQIIAEIIARENFTVAQQILEMLGLDKISRGAFHHLLVQLSRDSPSQSYLFVTWLISHNPNAVSSYTVNQILTILIKEHTLTESQIMNRFTSLTSAMKTHMKRNVSAKTAAEFVCALLDSAIRRQGGSRMRLKWALEIAQRAGVDEAEFSKWTAKLRSMSEKREGYWHNDQ